MIIYVVDFTCTRSLLDIRNLCLTYYWNFGEWSKITSGISFRGGGWNTSKGNVSLWKMLYFMLWFSLSVVWFWESFSHWKCKFSDIEFELDHSRFLERERERNNTRTNYWKPAKICKQPYFRSVDKVSEIVFLKNGNTEELSVNFDIFSSSLKMADDIEDVSFLPGLYF